jgi:adenosylcobinamide kinase/adenosylcobinamide-phosphate guanylyltransferase
MALPHDSAPRIILVTGPARSGKSEWAESLAMQSQKSVVYIATAQIDLTDLEWQIRIANHQERRPSSWKTLTVPVELAAAIQSGADDEYLVIDSLGTWLANLLDQDEKRWEQTLQELLQALVESKCHVTLVAEETGWGVVPAYPSGRLFRDRLGDLVRRVGAIANPVYLVTAGYVLNLSELAVPLPPNQG